jgi:hypothetical protein
MNPKLRKAYDSQEAFDDSIPVAEDITNDEQFYSILGPVFERNMKYDTNGGLWRNEA